jgi:hypothetical protein
MLFRQLHLFEWSTSTLDDFNAMCDGFGDWVEQLRAAR